MKHLSGQLLIEETEKKTILESNKMKMVHTTVLYSESSQREKLIAVKA